MMACAVRARPVHRRYAGIIYVRRRRTGHFRQGWSGAVVMEKERLLAALAYMALELVRARLVKTRRDWRWSSTPAHLARRGDGIRDRFAAFLAGAEDGEAFAGLRAAVSIGLPLGDEHFMAALERLTKRRLGPGRRRPKPKGREPGPAVRLKCTVTVAAVQLSALSP